MSLKGVESLRCQYITTQIFTCLTHFEWVFSIDLHSAECFQHPYNSFQMVYNWVHPFVGIILDKIFNPSLIDSWLVNSLDSYKGDIMDNCEGIYGFSEDPKSFINVTNIAFAVP